MRLHFGFMRSLQRISRHIRIVREEPMKMKVVIVICLFIVTSTAQNCIPRKFHEDSIVCVCNSTYCDSVNVNLPDKGTFRTYVTSRSGLRFETDTGNFENNILDENGIVLHLNTEVHYQSIHGFGGAFTDAAGINIAKLSNNTQDILIQSYFDENGSRYNLGRVPVGGTDFSTRAYTLDDVPGDKNLSHFALAREDYDYKIPYMKKATELNPDVKFLSAPWTAPVWMKTNPHFAGFMGFLKKRYYQTYADYLVDFLEAYQNEGLPIWAITTGNEPADAFIPLAEISDMAWTPSTVTNFIINNLAPAIKNSTSNETLIWVLDDQRVFLPWYINDMYGYNSEIDEHIAGIAVHWYLDRLAPVTVFDRTHALYPNKYLIMTEACIGSEPWEAPKVRLGHWGRGEEYISTMIEDFNHWITGWVDWNIVLDKAGGPNWINNNVDSSIIVNPETDEFFKQPMYYAISHFSKFVPRGSVKVDLSDNNHIQSVAFLTPENSVTVVLLNKKNKPTDITIVDPDLGNINVKVMARSMQTIIYQR